MGVTNDIVPSIVSIAYYWMGEGNMQAVEAIIGLLEQLSLDEKMKKKRDDLAHDFRAFFHQAEDYQIVWHVEIPKKDTEEQRLKWVAGVCLMNLFKAGSYEMGYTMLMIMSADWNDLYSYVVASIQNDPKIKNDLAQWLMTHFFMACDLLGMDEINMMGYTVKKNDNFS